MAIEVKEVPIKAHNSVRKVEQYHAPLRRAYKIIIANESTGENDFIIHGNLIHWSLTKSKYITRSVLALEIYGMVDRVNIVIAIGTTLKIITDRLKLPVIPIIVYTNSYSLYEYLVKLSTTKEKRLIINIIAL